jgi:hypothetical protein
MEALSLVLVVVIGYAVHHGKHYHRNRRRRLSVWVSMRGPFSTRISRRF